MPRYTRKRLIMAKTEVSYGVDPTLAAADDSILVSEIRHGFDPSNVDRNLIRPYFGLSEQLVGTRSRTLGYNVELVGRGPTGGAPAWAHLLRACGFSGAAGTPVTITAATISAAAADNSFSDSANGFGSFTAGMAVTVSGFTGNTANNGTFIVTTATAAKLTIAGADGDVIVNDAEGESVTITSCERYDFLPITDSVPSLTQYYNRDGVLAKLLGSRGTAVLRLVAGEMPQLVFDFRGKDGGLSAVALPGDSDFSDFMTPEIPTDANTLDLVFGGTISTSGAVAITGGTAIPTLGLEVNLGNQTPLVPLIGDESVDLVDRAVTATLSMDLTAAQEVARQLTVLGASTQSVGIIHGTAGGRRVALWLPTAQFTNPQERDFNGRALTTYELRGVPTGAGNNEARVVASF
jgi:hypothetical protein